MSSYIEKAEQLSLPVIALRDTVAFPSAPINFEISDDESIAAAEEANNGDSFVFLVRQTVLNDREIHLGELSKVGTVARIKQFVKSGDGDVRILAEGFSRASVLSYHRTADYVRADLLCKAITLPENGGIRGEAAIRGVFAATQKVFRFLSASGTDIVRSAKNLRDPGLLADFLAANILLHPDDKQQVLECYDPLKRAELLIFLLEKESDILALEHDIHKQVHERIEQNQREYYLKEQLRVIEEELGDGDSEIAEFERRIRKAKLPTAVEEKLLKENRRMSKTAFGSPEANVLRNYLDVCLELPWNAKSKDRLSIAQVKKVLDEDHDGLEKVKDRILEYLAVKQLSPDLKNQIICLVGPPGVGKTSIASSIARAMNRKYVRVSLGGVRDEAEIRGHRKTYIGAMPGRIMTALTNAGVNNPLVLLDEIDKLTQDAHGDPASALLEVLDPEQNKIFRDHFVEIPFDLSDCFFLATANSLDTVPRPLIDRMEIIRLDIYTKREKLSIAKNHLYPKQLKRHGLSKRMLRITDGGFDEMISYYTKEAGVRTLERTIAELCRKCAKKFVENEEQKRITVDETNLSEFLGPRKLLPECIEQENEVGVVNGLAYTELGGDLLKVECAVLEGTGKVELTGSLGDVMKESAMAAISYVRSIAKEYGISTDFYRTKDIHIHAPEGAVPKDGPSAGVTMTTALVSALTGYPVRSDIAMTGEISLRGRVLAIGGLKEKTMAAYAAGVRTVLIPKDNERDLQNIDPLARDNLTFIPCSRLADVLKEALIRPDAPAKEPVIIPADTKTAHCPKTEPPHAQPTANFAPEHEEKESHTC